VLRLRPRPLWVGGVSCFFLDGVGWERGGRLLTVEGDQLVADEIVAGREAGRDGVVVAVVVVEHQGGLVIVGCG
jgi:hypothetical protein